MNFFPYLCYQRKDRTFLEMCTGISSPNMLLVNIYDMIDYLHSTLMNGYSRMLVWFWCECHIPVNQIIICLANVAASCKYGKSFMTKIGVFISSIYSIAFQIPNNFDYFWQTYRTKYLRMDQVKFMEDSL